MSAACATCGQPATKSVAARYLCADHAAQILESCWHAARRRILTPPEPLELDDWQQLLEHGITIGVITNHEARLAWDGARERAA